MMPAVAPPRGNMLYGQSISPISWCDPADVRVLIRECLNPYPNGYRGTAPIAPAKPWHSRRRLVGIVEKSFMPAFG
jgi:hypothetical protein